MSAREYRKKIYEDTSNFEDRLANIIHPQSVFGGYVEEEFESNYYKIFFTILFTLIVGILSTITYSDIKDNNDITSNIVVAIASISWFVFISFIFLLFSATRFLHICMFISLIILSSFALNNLENHNKDMMIAILVFSSLGFLILSYYYTLSKTRTDVQTLRKEAKFRKDEEKIQERIIKAQEEAIKEEMKKVKKMGDDKEDFKKEMIGMLAQKLTQNQKYQKPQRKFQEGEPVNRRYNQEEINEE